jgi:hypothetical protein
MGAAPLPEGEPEARAEQGPDPADTKETLTDTIYQSGGEGINISTVVTASGAEMLTYDVADVVLFDATTGETYSVYTGGTAGSIDGAENAETVITGEYTQQHFGPGF